MRDVERKLEMKEMEERRRNIVIRRIKGGKEEVEKEVEGIMKELGGGIRRSKKSRRRKRE